MFPSRLPRSWPPLVWLAWHWLGVARLNNRTFWLVVFSGVTILIDWKLGLRPQFLWVELFGLARRPFNANDCLPLRPGFLFC